MPLSFDSCIICGFYYEKSVSLPPISSSLSKKSKSNNNPTKTRARNGPKLIHSNSLTGADQQAIETDRSSDSINLVEKSEDEKGAVTISSSTSTKHKIRIKKRQQRNLHQDDLNFLSLPANIISGIKRLEETHAQNHESDMRKVAQQFFRAVSLESLHALAIEEVVAMKANVNLTSDQIQLTKRQQSKHKIFPTSDEIIPLRKIPLSKSNSSSYSYLSHVESISSLYAASRQCTQQSYPQLILGPTDANKPYKEIILFRTHSPQSTIDPVAEVARDEADFAGGESTLSPSWQAHVPRLSPLKPLTSAIKSNEANDKDVDVDESTSVSRPVQVEEPAVPKSWLWTDLIVEQQYREEEEHSYPLHVYFQEEEESDDDEEGENIDDDGNKKEVDEQVKFETKERRSFRRLKQHLLQARASQEKKSQSKTKNKDPPSGGSFFWGSFHNAHSNGKSVHSEEEFAMEDELNLRWDAYGSSLLAASQSPSFISNSFLNSLAEEDGNELESSNCFNNEGKDLVEIVPLVSRVQSCLIEDEDAFLCKVDESKNQIYNMDHDEGIVSTNNSNCAMSHQIVAEQALCETCEVDNIAMHQIEKLMGDRVHRAVERNYDFQALEEQLLSAEEHTPPHSAHIHKHFFFQRFRLEMDSSCIPSADCVKVIPNDADNSNDNNNENNSEIDNFKGPRIVGMTRSEELPDSSSPMSAANETARIADQNEEAIIKEELESGSEQQALDVILQDLDLLARHRSKALQLAESSSKLYSIQQIDPLAAAKIHSMAPVISEVEATLDTNEDLQVIFARIVGLKEDLQALRRQQFSVQISTAYQQHDKQLKQVQTQITKHPWVKDVRYSSGTHASIFEYELGKLTHILNEGESLLIAARDTLPELVREIVRRFHRQSETQRQALALQVATLLGKLNKLNGHPHISIDDDLSHAVAGLRSTTPNIAKSTSLVQNKVPKIEALGEELRLTQTCEALFLEHARVEEAAMQETLSFWRPRLLQTINDTQLVLCTGKSHRTLHMSDHASIAAVAQNGSDDVASLADTVNTECQSTDNQNQQSDIYIPQNGGNVSEPIAYFPLDIHMPKNLSSKQVTKKHSSKDNSSRQNLLQDKAFHGKSIAKRHMIIQQSAGKHAK
jgi:hypothetical protein